MPVTTWVTVVGLLGTCAAALMLLVGSGALVVGVLAGLVVPAVSLLEWHRSRVEAPAVADRNLLGIWTLVMLILLAALGPW
jgi:hypothetical protein